MDKDDVLCEGLVPCSLKKDRPGIRGWHILKTPGCDDLPANGGSGLSVLVSSVRGRRYERP